MTIDAQFWSGLLQIILIDLALAGDNAIVIALVASRVPRELQMKAVIWGTALAVLVRIIATLGVVILFKIPLLLALGGAVLLWVGYKVIVDQAEEPEIDDVGSLREAIRVIVVADVAMAVDNMLAVAGASHGRFELVIIGLLISIVIMVACSRLILRLVERYPVIVYVGSGVIVWTAAGMILEDPLVHARIDLGTLLRWVVIVASVAIVLGAGYLRSRRIRRTALQPTNS